MTTYVIVVLTYQQKYFLLSLSTCLNLPVSSDTTKVMTRVKIKTESQDLFKKILNGDVIHSKHGNKTWRIFDY